MTGERRTIVLPVILSLLLSSFGLGAQSTLPLVQEANLVYEGAFRLPGGTFGGSDFAYGGTALAYSAARNSLFIVGHDWHQMVAEVSIPAARTSKAMAELTTATVIQPFADPLEGRMREINPDDPNSKKIGGLLAYGGQLYVSAFSYYDGNGSQILSHFVSGLDLRTTGDLRGPVKVGTVGAGFVSGYFAEVPADLQSMLGGPVVNGNCCLGVIGRTSYGPALFALTPNDIGAKKSVPAIPLVYYTSKNFVNDWNVTSKFFNGTTSVRGVVIPAGTRSVLFFGRHGLGPFCYGTGADCHDPVDDSKGTHAYPYASYVWAYDALDLAAVKSGQKKPWQVRPYATWQLQLPAFAGNAGQVNGATYDAKTGRIYLTQAFADGPIPIVHVLTISAPRANPLSGNVVTQR